MATLAEEAREKAKAYVAGGVPYGEWDNPYEICFASGYEQGALAAIAEAQRLRAALQMIADDHEEHGTRRKCCQFQDIAMRALGKD